jgi:predicted Zn-dependent peptidase
VRRLAATRPDSRELDRVKQHLIGTRAISRQRSAARAAGLALGYLYGLGHDADQRYPGQIARVSGARVVETARRFLDPARMVIACVGPDAERLDLLAAGA